MIHSLRTLRVGAPLINRGILQSRMDVMKNPVFIQPKSSIHLSPTNLSLEEFFENEKFRGEKTVRVGREWR